MHTEPLAAWFGEFNVVLCGPVNGDGCAAMEHTGMTNKTSILLLRDVGFASASYCTVCFAVIAALYVVGMKTGMADIRDPTTGAPVDVILSAHALFELSLFMGLFGTLFCLGGLLGVWVLATGSDRRGFHHVLGGALMGAIASGVIMLSSSGDDHLGLRACSVAAISLMIALLVRVYTSKNRVERETDAAARRD